MKKIIPFIPLFVIVLLCSACTPQENKNETLANAKLFDKAENYMKEQYLTENQTHYPFTSDGLPENRCQIIDTEDKFADIFESFPEEPDFSTDILVIYIFTDIYYRFDCKLQDIKENEGDITIVIEHEMAEPEANGAVPPSTSMPIQRCLVVQLSDYSFDNVNVELVYP